MSVFVSELPSFILRPYGRCAWLVEGLSTEWMSQLVHMLNRSDQSPLEFIEYSVGFERLMLCFGSPVEEAIVHAWVESLFLCERCSNSVLTEAVKIPVVYDGPDLDFVFQVTGLSRDVVIELHSSPIYRVRMIGFTPGFPYLDGLDVSLQIPRRKSPRNRILAGSVAIGGPHAGVYSVASPGGWHLLGRTVSLIFDSGKAKGIELDLKDGSFRAWFCR